jgi:hypothetical protein
MNRTSHGGRVVLNIKHVPHQIINTSGILSESGRTNRSENIPSCSHRILLGSLYVFQEARSKHSRENLQESTNGHEVNVCRINFVSSYYSLLGYTSHLGRQCFGGNCCFRTKE